MEYIRVPECIGYLANIARLLGQESTRAMMIWPRIADIPNRDARARVTNYYSTLMRHAQDLQAQLERSQAVCASGNMRMSAEYIPADVESLYDEVLNLPKALDDLEMEIAMVTPRLMVTYPISGPGKRGEGVLLESVNEYGPNDMDVVDVDALELVEERHSKRRR